MATTERKKTHYNSIVIECDREGKEIISPDYLAGELLGYHDCRILTLEIRNMSRYHYISGISGVHSIGELILINCDTDFTWLDGLDNVREVRISTYTNNRWTYPFARGDDIYRTRYNGKTHISVSSTSLEKLNILYTTNTLSVDVSNCSRLTTIDLPLCRGIKGLENDEFKFIGMYIDREKVLDDLSGINTRILKLDTYDLDRITLEDITVRESLNLSIDRWQYRKNPLLSIDIKNCDLESVQSLRVDGMVPDDLSFIYHLKNLREVTFGYLENRTIDLVPLINCKNLRSISIGSNHHNFDGLDLTPLSKLEHLERISIPRIEGLDVTPLLGLPKLIEFECYAREYVADISERGRIQNSIFQEYDRIGYIKYSNQGN